MASNTAIRKKRAAHRTLKTNPQRHIENDNAFIYLTNAKPKNPFDGNNAEMQDDKIDLFSNLKEGYENFYKMLHFSSDDDNPNPCDRMFKSTTVGIENYHKKVLENMKSTTEELEKKIMVAENLLKSKKDERKILETDARSKNAFLFSCLAFEEHLRKNRGLGDKSSDDSSEDAHQTTHKKTKKNFLHRNIELAASAMPKLSLTDEEKHRLEEILLEDEEDENHTPNSERVEKKHDLINAFRLCEDAENRIGEIDVQLQGFADETQHLKTSNGDLVDSFWKSLILEQMMTEIDKKLVALKEQEQEELEKVEEIG